MGDARKRIEATVEVEGENGLKIRPETTELTEKAREIKGKPISRVFTSSRLHE